MIELKVEEYCHNCPDFEADVVKNRIRDVVVFVDYTDTTITCAHAARCRAVKRYLEKQSKGE